MSRRLVNWLILILTIAVLVTGCSGAKTLKGSTLEEVISKSERLNNSVIVHIENLNNGALIFHIPNINGDKPESRLGAEFLKKTPTGWEVSDKGGAYSSGIPQPFYCQYLPSDGDSPFPMLYGEIKDTKIDSIVVKNTDDKVEGKTKIIRVSRKPGISHDMSIWYIFLNETGNGKFNVEGLSNNKVVFKIDVKPSGNSTVPATGEPNISSEDLQTLRGKYFDFGIENRLDYVPVFDEGKAPSSSTEYLFYAFAVNLDNWGDDKGTMTRSYVEQVIRTHFRVKDITHSLRKGWNYDGDKYTAIPQGIKEKPIYVLKEINTHIQDSRTVYEITLDNCSFGDVIPTGKDMANIRESIVSGELSGLTVLQTERFKYYLDENGAVVFLSHTLV